MKEWVKLNEKFDVYHIYSVQKITTFKFWVIQKIERPAGLPNTDPYIFRFFMLVEK